MAFAPLHLLEEAVEEEGEGEAVVEEEEVVGVVVVVVVVEWGGDSRAGPQLLEREAEGQRANKLSVTYFSC